MRIAFLGTGAFGQATLRALLAAGHEITCVISQPDRPSGRGRRIQPTPIHELADELNLIHHQVSDLNALAPSTLAAGTQLGFVAAFGQKIGANWLDAFPHGLVNLHASLLPRHRGAAPFQWALLSGDTETGVTIFRLDADWDAGPIYGQARTPIDPHETASELHDRLAMVGAGLAVEVVAQIAGGTVRPQDQDISLATRAPKLSKADGVLDFSRDAHALQRQIHGLWSWPTATCWLEHEDQRIRLQLARAEVIDPDAPATDDCPPGTLRADLSVQTGRGRLRLLEVKPAGGRLMSLTDFARGRQIAAGARLTRWTPDDPV